MKKTVWAVLAALVLAGCGSSAARWPGEAAVRKGMEDIGFFDIPEKSAAEVNASRTPILFRGVLSGIV